MKQEICRLTPTGLNEIGSTEAKRIINNTGSTVEVFRSEHTSYLAVSVRQ